MEVERFFYIFGSFSRKRQDRGRKSLEPSSISAGNSPLKGSNSRASSQNMVTTPRTSAYGSRKKRIKEWECGICGKELVEPRLLACLHSFCTRCLQELQYEDVEWESVDKGSLRHDPRRSGPTPGGGSAGSGYESDLRHSGSDTSLDKLHRCAIVTRKISGRNCHFVVCPTCATETPLPLGGIAALPLNYVILRKMTARETGSSVLCDLCCADNKAESRCSQCLVSVCTNCSDSHTRQKGHASHLLQPLEPLLRFCGQHPKTELSVYCATCQQVICRDCCLISHAGHAVANASRAANDRAAALRDACERAKHVPGNVQRANTILEVHAAEVDAQASHIEHEIRTWAEEYRRAVEAHGRELCTTAVRARAAYRMRVKDKVKLLDERAQEALEAVKFAEELLSQGKTDEILSLHAPVLRRLERVTELPAVGDTGNPLRFSRLAPAHPAHPSPAASLVGRVYTTTPDPQKCVVNTEGLLDLQVGVPHTVMLELRDSDGEHIWSGEENVAGYLRRRDSSARPAALAAVARGGRHVLALTPPAPGRYLLAVTLDHRPVLGSPFRCVARVSAAHSGTFHCCAFCSSGGRRDAVCACDAPMAHGYKGCGHGHGGWPGARHWSCCGSTHKDSRCTRVRHQPYQFSL